MNNPIYKLSQSAKSPLNNSDYFVGAEWKVKRLKSQSAKSPLNNSDVGWFLANFKAIVPSQSAKSPLNNSDLLQWNGG